MGWYAAAIFVANFLFMRLSTGLTLKRSILAYCAVSGLSWIFVAAVPIPLYGFVIARDLLVGYTNDPISWMIPVLLSALSGALVGAAALAVLKQRITRRTFWFLTVVNLVCVAVAVFRMVIYVSAIRVEA
jgi:hypothetical protein